MNFSLAFHLCNRRALSRESTLDGEGKLFRRTLRRALINKAEALKEMPAHERKHGTKATDAADVALFDL